MEYISNLNIDEFNDFAKNHFYNSIFQSTSWAKTKNNWQAKYVGVKEGEKLIGASMILLRSLPMNFKFAYMPRGPLIDFNDDKLLEFFFNNLKNDLASNRVLLAKFDPNVAMAELPFIDKDKIKDIKDEKFVSNLSKYGIRHCGYGLLIKDSIQPRIQLELESEFYKDIIPNKTMKKIRASFNKGVVIKKGNVDEFSEMINYTIDRHNISLRNKSYFENLLSSFKDDACVLNAYVDNQLISSCLLVKCKSTCEILYSGYNDEFKKYNSTYPLRFEAIKYAKENNCKYFSFGGVEGTLDDGLTLFKSSFNPKIRVYVGEFDIKPLPVLSDIVSYLFPFLKSRIRF